MIEKLEQLTIGQFVDLICGDTSVLTGKLEKVSPTRLAIVMRNIVFEYKEIADMSGVRTYLSEIEELIKAKMYTVVYSMCSNLIELKEYERAREVLIECGINARTMSESRLSAEVKSNLERAKYNVAKIEKQQEADRREDINIRREFDAQTAALMAYFKFQIDMSTMKASLYAHLIARHNAEVKAQLAAMKVK